MAREVRFIGPVFNAFSPVTGLLMFVKPWESVEHFGQEPLMGRASLFAAAVIAGAGYSGIVYIFLIGMVKGFDHTVRRLSGTG